MIAACPTVRRVDVSQALSLAGDRKQALTPPPTPPPCERKPQIIQPFYWYGGISDLRIRAWSSLV